jgi:hypothetical protein
MESLKKLEDICQPDIRQKSFVCLDPGGPDGFRSQTLQDFHRAAESIVLHEGVPERIRNQFQDARNLIVYSWFYYPFNVTAELCAYATAEHALRIKAGETTGHSSFRRLLKRAVAENWIRDSGFSHVKRKHESLRAYNENLPPEFQQPQAPLAQEYCNAVTDALPNLRNALAHGDNYLHHSGAMTVRICADLINQLFEKPASLEAAL